VEEEKAVLSVLRYGQISQGSKVKEFESMIKSYCGVKNAVALSSGTAALISALRLAGVDGQEVCTSPISFVATPNAIIAAGGIPKFVDVGDDCLINPSLIDTPVSVPVDLFGQMCDYKRIKGVSIADAAHSMGSFRSLISGKAATFTCFSFYASKNLSCGEGGMVVSDKSLSNIKLFRQFGSESGFDYKSFGLNYMMTDIEAAIGIEQLKKLDYLNSIRAENAMYLTSALKDYVEVPSVIGFSSWHLYTIRVKKRDSLMKFLRKNGVDARVYYPKVLYDYSHLKKYKTSCPNAERLVKEILSLPVHPGLSKKDLDKIIRLVKKFYS